MAHHDCVKSGCSGQNLYGISLTCQCCFKPVFMECIQTRKEVTELTEAFGFSDLQYTSSFQGQQQLITKMKNMFAGSSVFEFVCVKCKNMGNRFIDANAKQGEMTAKLNGMKNELDSTKKELIDVNNKLKTEIDNANQLHVKCQHAEAEIQRLNGIVTQMKFEFEQQQILNNELQSKVSAASQNQTQANEECAAMDIDQLSSSLTSYNAEIRDCLQKTLDSVVNRIENSMATQYQNLMSTLAANDPCSKRKQPYDTNHLNTAASSLTSQTPAQGNAQNAHDLEPPEEKSKPKPSRSIYELFVSKFKNDTTVDKIIQHVINKTEIKDPELFSVEMLVKANGNVQKLSYVSFKITTCSEKVYEAIMNDGVWAPNFTAVPFIDQKYGKNGNGTKLNSKPQTPKQMNQSRHNDHHESGAKSQKRRPKVKFDDMSRGNKANHQNATPRSSRNAWKNSSNIAPSPKLPPHSQVKSNAFAMHLPQPMVQQPAFFGMPSVINNQMHPLYYQMHQQQSYQQPQMSHQQQQASINNQQQLHYQQHRMQ